MPELSPEMVKILDEIAEHEEICPLTFEACCLLAMYQNQLKALGYTFTLPEISREEIL